MIVDFGIDTFTSLRVLLTLLDAVKVYLFVCYFFNQRIKYAIINFNFLPWSFRPFGVAKLAIGFLFFKSVCIVDVATSNQIQIFYVLNVFQR